MATTTTLPTNQSIASTLRMLRKQAELTQVKLSQESGLSQSAISDMERGNRLDLDNLRAVSGPLGMSVWQLMRMAESLDKAPEAVRGVITTGAQLDAILDEDEMDALMKKTLGK